MTSRLLRSSSIHGRSLRQITETPFRPAFVWCLGIAIGPRFDILFIVWLVHKWQHSVLEDWSVSPSPVSCRLLRRCLTLPKRLQISSTDCAASPRAPLILLKSGPPGTCRALGFSESSSDLVLCLNDSPPIALRRFPPQPYIFTMRLEHKSTRLPTKLQYKLP